MIKNFNKNNIEILVVDDSLETRQVLQTILKQAGFNVKLAKNSTEAIDSINRKPSDLVLLDNWLKGSHMDGISVLETIKHQYNIPVIMMTNSNSLENAIIATQIGAYDYLEKPFIPEKVLLLVQRALENSNLTKENKILKSKIVEEHEIIGTSKVIDKLRLEIDKIAPSYGRILISGHAGSCKELVAKIIHNKSKFANSGSFIYFNPSEMTKEQINQELFSEFSMDHLNKLRRESLFEKAYRGTLYIHNIDSLPLECQSKLNKILQEQIIINYTNNHEIKLDFRFICSTSKNLEDLVIQGKFKQELLNRINILPIRIPALEDRKEDITLLVEHFAKQISIISGLKQKKFSRNIINILESYDWPGDVMQLKNIVEWALIMDQSQNDIIQINSLPKEILNDNTAIVSSNTNIDIYKLSLSEATKFFQLKFISKQLQDNGFNVTKTAEKLSMERSALHRKMKNLTDSINFCISKDPELIIENIPLLRNDFKTLRDIHKMKKFSGYMPSNLTKNFNNPNYEQVNLDILVNNQESK
ncbi:MAG: sigma-54 dependent transcriptional regulator [Rickettsiales bacterium]